MQLSCDALGFPRIKILRSKKSAAARFWLSMFPVTKMQYESFLAEPDSLGDLWYEQILAANERRSLTSPDGDLEGIFVTGIFPQELKVFVEWLRRNGEPNCDIPTAEEWREAYRYLKGAEWAPESMHWDGEVSNVAEKLIRACFRKNPISWLEATLMIDGLTEWVRETHEKSTEYCGLGRPRAGFFPSTSDPLNECFRPTAAGRNDRMKYVGARLMFRLS
jgi:hypothetical protein